MRSILLTGALACGAACAQTTDAPASNDWKVYTDVSIWQASDAVPIRQIDGDWTAYSPRAGRNMALMRSRAAVGVEKSRWRVGVELRQDAMLATNRETLDAYDMYQQKRKPASPASFALEADYFFWRAHGLRIGYTLAGPRIGGRASAIEISGAAYGNQKLRERSVRGNLTYAQEDTYVFAVTHIDADSRMTYPFMGEAPRATGAGLSLAATIPLAAAWTLRVQADDVASRLRWKNLPLNTEALESDVKSFDDDGYVHYRPLLRGRKRQLDRSFHIPRYNAAALDYQQRDSSVGLHLARYAGETIPTVSVSHRFGLLTVRGNVETRFNSAGIGLETGNVRFQLQSDSFDLNEAKARSLQLHYHRVF